MFGIVMNERDKHCVPLLVHDKMLLWENTNDAFCLEEFFNPTNAVVLKISEVFWYIFWNAYGLSDTPEMYFEAQTRLPIISKCIV